MTQETIGKNIRKARRDLELTQDELAERLAVTESAVSQWELGKTVPDLMLIPTLCAVLGVTADWLLGVDAEKRREEIEAIEDRAEALSVVGHKKESAEILRDGLKQYPESERLLWLLMHDSDDQEEVIRIGERLLETSRNENLRQSAIQNLVYAYTDRGDIKRAEEVAMMLPAYPLDRNDLFLYIRREEGGEEYRTVAARRRYRLLDDLCRTLYQGVDRETAAERVIRLFGLMYEDRDFGFNHTRLKDAWVILAFAAARKGDADRTLHVLREAADHALAFLNYLADPDFRYTSVFFRNQWKGSFETNSPQNEAWEVLERMKDPIFDFVRDTLEFKTITDRLSAEAGEWKVKE